MTKLLVLIDGSIYTQSVCDHAAWVAARTKASVDLLHVLGRRTVSSVPADFSGNLNADARDTLLAELAGLDEQQAKLAQKRGRLILEEAKARLTQAGIADVTTKLRNGDLLETVQEFEPEADLILIGKRGEAADFASLHLGSNLERVVRASHKPVLVASRAFRPVGSFLIAYDGGASADKAVDHIAQGHLFPSLACRLLMAGQPDSAMTAKLEAAAAKLRAAGYGVTAGVEAGQPDAVIARTIEQEGIGLLVMGAYGHSRIRTLIIGSTTTEMIRSCLVPVMLFR
ncbi:universal stress protein [Oceanibaculum indicum]|uniref:UspA domain-containing protein n=1 Tax=Oceanibaculum indicum P24 TaxID=1207063 RepID=K2JRZ7_9PROT|nr:universal stress protein [Oceanibaculum indicum]EKE78223.1 UspA domain-containing protein [Oceanibaculum indicum P24]